MKVKKSEHPLSDALAAFMRELAAATHNCKPLYLTSSGRQPPSIELKANLHFFVIPVGAELEPFLQTLVMVASGEYPLSKKSARDLQNFMRPTQIEALISSQCPHCPQVVKVVGRLAVASNYFLVRVIDVQLFPELVGRYNIRSLPTVIIDGEEQLLGTVSEDVLLDRVLGSSPSIWSAGTFKYALKQGDADKLARVLLAEGEIPPDALQLLGDPEWPVRLGMMVVLEEIAARDIELGRRAVPYLLELVSHRDSNLRGDAAYLLGLIGDRSVSAKLAEVALDENEEVAAAAREALKRISLRGEKEASC
ncbi:MAG: thioredoxin family protein [Deltaproteobacteria bacterium]|nr:thioredoxin family protein [Deltaproteobacteria bacterium]MBW2069653.1 thioredoxin family protein [Deltaproteobacteria bacterium]